jgi:hypothetical protein
MTEESDRFTDWLQLNKIPGRNISRILHNGNQIAIAVGGGIQGIRTANIGRLIECI